LTIVLIALAVTVVAAAAVANRNDRFRARLRDERGEVTEKVIITALFAALALTAATIITLKVTQKANSIPTDPSPAQQQQDGGLGK
jgi:heme/copper-type cytochrome/quinol oxidase subunit 2